MDQEEINIRLEQMRMRGMDEKPSNYFAKVLTLDELIDQFPNGREKYNYDPIFRSVIKTLEYNGNPYLLYDQLISIVNENRNQMEEMIKRGGPAPMVVEVSKEHMKYLVSETVKKNRWNRLMWYVFGLLVGFGIGMVIFSV